MRASTSPSDNVYKSTAVPSAVSPKACLVTLVSPCIVAVSIMKETRIANQALTLSGSIFPLVFLLVFVSARYCTGPAYWHVERGGEQWRSTIARNGFVPLGHQSLSFARPLFIGLSGNSG